MKQAIVLSGGGSRGAYQIGVWKALKKLRIKYDIVTGTSVGALNGVLMTQNSFKDAYKLWSNMNFNVVFDENIKENFSSKEGKKEIVKMYAKNITLEGGMNAVNLYDEINRLVDEDKVRNSRIDFGLVTVKYPSLKNVSLSKKDIPKGKLKSYLIASSACFPAFQKKEIDDEYYIDGGYYDNLPINLACSMGADKIIAVDLDAVGLKQKIKNKNVDIEVITSKHDLGSFLVFDKELSNKNIFYGYTDTLKKFRKLDGDFYSFKRHEFNKLHKKYDYKFFDKFREIDVNDNKISKFLKMRIYKKVLNSDNTLLEEIVEQLGKIVKIDDTKIYRISSYNKILLNKINDINIDNINKSSKYLKLLEKDKLIKYLYLLIKSKNYKELDLYVPVFSKEILYALYISIIS